MLGFSRVFMLCAGYKNVLFEKKKKRQRDRSIPFTNLLAVECVYVHDHGTGLKQ